MDEAPLYASVLTRLVFWADLGFLPHHDRGSSKLWTHTAVGPYGRFMPRSIGPS